MNLDRRRMIAGQIEAIASRGEIVPTVWRLIAIAASCLMLTACGQRIRGGPAATGPTSVAKGGTENGADERAKIELAWKEQDRFVHEHLDSYGWVDHAAGLVHIPIERAMNLIVAEKRSSGPAPDQIKRPNSWETNTDLQNTGRRLFKQYGCTVCHDPDAVSHAPSLIGIYGQRVRLSDGTFVRADDKYLHDSIMLASKQVVAGYEPVMPAFGSIIPEPDVRELIAYLKSTSPSTPPVPAPSR